MRHRGRMEHDDETRAQHGLWPGVPYEYGAVAPPGSVLFTAGACPLDVHGHVVGPGDHLEQTQVALTNLLAVLDAHGAGPEHLLRTTVYVIGDQPTLVQTWEVVAAGLAPARPPSTLLGVSALGYPGQLVEIDGVAALPR
jgi:enamine deaminase RidA (YjgF/YER057c/UK114 family)